jgi:GNAT superfamily N-acetyltransferase
MPIEITQAGPDDVDAVAQLIAEAFTTLAVSEWLVEDAAERFKVLADNFRIYVEHALAHGTVYTAAGQAAAVWFHLDQEPVPAPPDYDRRLAAACGPWTDGFQILDDLFERHHPDQPHHYLAFLAVRRQRQGQGVGSALLHHHLDQVDAIGTSAYLEASSEQSRKLYLRHGFKDFGEPFYLPEGPPFWPMWRAEGRQTGHTRNATRGGQP